MIFYNINPSINQGAPQDAGGTDRYGCRREVEERIDAHALSRQFGYEEVKSVVELLTDILCSTRPTLRIGGTELPAKQVKDRLSRLEYRHLAYVFDCLRKNAAPIRNIRAYLLTTLYNAPGTLRPGQDAPA